MNKYAAASWSTKLKVTSTFSVILLLILSVVAYFSIPIHTGRFTHLFGLLIALMLPCVLIGALLFVVNCFVIEGHTLLIQRLLWSTKVPLSGLISARQDSAACDRSVRLFGNGGLFSFTGVYQNRAVGRFRLFATNFNHTVVLSFADHTVIITPQSPKAFLKGLSIAVPSANIPG